MELLPPLSPASELPPPHKDIPAKQDATTSASSAIAAPELRLTASVTHSPATEGTMQQILAIEPGAEPADIHWKSLVVSGCLHVTIFMLFAILVELGAHVFGIPNSMLQSWKTQHAMDKADIAVMGNAMAYNAVDFKALEKMTGKEILDLTEDGFRTPAWYLQIKNLLSKLDQKPRYALIFFRDYDLTNATYDPMGFTRKNILLMSENKEPAMEQYVLKPSMSAQRYLAYKLSPAFRGKEEIRQHLFDATSQISALITGIPRSQAADSITAVMELAGKKTSTTYDPPQRIFTQSLQSSLLPLMVSELRTMNITPVFIRIKVRQYVHKTDTKTMAKYVMDLRKYLEKEGALFYDYTQDKDIELRHFSDGIHMNDEGREIFTNALARDLLTLPQ